MNEQLLSAKNVIVQGITGSQGSFHTKAMLAAGTNIVAGTSPNKAGKAIEGIPVYKTISEIKTNHEVDASVIFVPAPHAKAAIMEAINAKIPLIVCITEGIPIHDMLQIKQHIERASSRLIGPNCPGVLLPGNIKLGIIPKSMATRGNVGVVSRSGTLTYEVMAGLSARNIGQKYIIGIGGDPIKGTGFTESLELFEKDPDITNIVLIGEIGGNDEILAGEYIKTNLSKPVYAYVAGHTAPIGVRLGHAGAILDSDDKSAASKTKYLNNQGVHTFNSVTDLISNIPN